MNEKLRALYKGALQGSTMGLADEAIGGVGALYARALNPELFQGDSFSNTYAQARDLDRAENKQLEQNNPWTYGGANLVGGVAMPMGMAGQGLKGAVKAGGIAGGLTGYGMSENTNPYALALDTATGAGLGAGAGAALYGAGKVATNPQVQKFAKDYIADESGSLKMLPHSEKLNLPNNPTKKQMVDFSYIDDVPLNMVRSGQNKMEWDKFNKKEYAAPLIDGFSDFPVAVKLENGEYIIKDGNHRTVNLINSGVEKTKMHIIDAKNFDPERQGVKPKPNNKKEIDDLFNELLK